MGTFVPILKFREFPDQFLAGRIAPGLRPLSPFVPGGEVANIMGFSETWNTSHGAEVLLPTSTIYIYILLYLIDSMCSNRFQPYIPHTYIYIYIYPSMCSNRIPTASHGSFSLWKLIQPLGLSRVSRVPHFQTPPGIIFFVSYGKHNPMKIAITLW